MAKHSATWRLTLVDTFPDTLPEVLATTIADTLTCAQVEAPVKTEGHIDAGLEAYTDVDTINEFEALALVYQQSHTFS